MAFMPIEIQWILSALCKSIPDVENRSIHTNSDKAILVQLLDRVPVPPLATTNDRCAENQFRAGGQFQESIEADEPLSDVMKSQRSTVIKKYETYTQ